MFDEPEEALLVVGAVVTPVLEASHPEFAEQIIFECEQRNADVAVFGATIDGVHRLGNDHRILVARCLDGRALVRSAADRAPQHSAFSSARKSRAIKAQQSPASN